MTVGPRRGELHHAPQRLLGAQGGVEQGGGRGDVVLGGQRRVDQEVGSVEELRQVFRRRRVGRVAGDRGRAQAREPCGATGGGDQRDDLGVVPDRLLDDVAAEQPGGAGH